MEATGSGKVGPNKKELPPEDQIVSDIESENSISLSVSLEFSIDKMANNATLRELANPNLVVQPLSVTCPTLDRSLKQKSGFLNLLPKFHSLLNVDPYRFINEFIIICSPCNLRGFLSTRLD